MTTTISFFLACLTIGSVLGLIPVSADEVSAHAPPQKEAILDFKSAARTNKSAHRRDEIPRDGYSPLFQVSSNPQDVVRLSVNRGIVTVQGSIGSKEQAQELLQRFRQIPGTRQVRNRLTVRTNHDASIARELREALSQDPDTHAGAIAVTVQSGRVFLSGNVSSEQERQRAEELAREQIRVKKVINGLTLPTTTRNNARLISTTRAYPRPR